MGKNNFIKFVTATVTLPLTLYSWGRGEIIHHKMIGDKGSKYIETITIHDGLGRPVQTIDNGVNTGSIPVVTVLEPSPNGNPHIEWLPFASQGVAGRLDKTDVRDMASTFHSDNHAFSESAYDALGRKTFVATSGEAWHNASKGVSIRYSTNTASSVRLYSADVNGKALYEDGFWPPCTLMSVTETDEDGQTIEVFSDFRDRKILERRAGEYDTYYVYNNAGQLRFVLSPGYELSGYKDEFAYEYRYDNRGNIIQQKEITRFGTLVTTDNTFSFTNQVLTSKMTDSCGVTILTENTYDGGCDLLLKTDVTINGTKQTISSFSYDDLGRVSSVVRGNRNRSVGSISYTYNLHGQISSITGTGFSQKLYYADSPYNKLYNGNIGSMTWTMGSDPTVRGYKYSYNDCNWLTLAEYGEGSSLADHKNRYTEKCSEFMPNGGIRRLQRHGLKADGEYGKIDNLHIYYTGNRITSILEDAKPVTQPGSMDYPGKQKEMAFGYNEWGALVKDESRGITNIEYDDNGNPYIISYSDGSYSKNIYSANGEKLISELCTDLSAAINPLALTGNEDYGNTSSYGISGNIKTEYRGPIIYRNGQIEMIKFPGGYATISGNNVTFHYYTQDYLGNNRAVVNGTTGAIEQLVAYYPFGGVIADLGTGHSLQQYKFGGKELLTVNGLNEYDFGARRYYQAVPMFTQLDPFADKFPWLSPYVYCANNPINFIDLNGDMFETPLDAAFLVGDALSAVYYHVKGEHNTAIGYWGDACYDVFALLVPGLPAGASKVVKGGVSTIRYTNTASNAAKSMKNADAVKEGIEFELKQLRKTIERGDNVSSQTRVVPLNGKGNKPGNRSDLDQLIKHEDGTYTTIETKRSSTTPLTKGQKAVENHVKNGNGNFEIRSDKPEQEISKGDIIKIKEYKRINKYNK